MKWGPLVQGELRDPHLIQKAIEQYHVEAVLHFASYAYVGESVENPRKYMRCNVLNGLNLLDAMLATGVRNIIFSSSCATYGIPQRIPIGEDLPQLPVNPYGESKLYMERALQWYGEAYGIRWVALRYFNAAGADPEGQIGEEHTPETHLIPLLIRAALGQGAPVRVFGSDYPTPDGTAIRDYIHVTDLAEAHVLALDYLASGGPSLGLNLGTGKGHSVKEVIDSVERVSGRKVPRQEAPRRPGDPPVLVADASRARQVLTWKPLWEELDAIVSTALEWHRKSIGKAQGEAGSSGAGPKG